MDCIFPNLYISGTPSSLQPLDDVGITHVLSVAHSFEGAELGGRIHKVVGIDDQDEEDILSLFPECIEFITMGIAEGKVLVHCQLGVSRSGAVVAAYLMQSQSIPLEVALKLVTDIRPIVKPNSGFMEQLMLWERMGYKIDPLHPAYRNRRLQYLADQRIENGFININDLTNDPEKVLDAKRVYRCKKCRRQLYVQKNIIEHDEGTGQDSFKWHKRNDFSQQQNAKNVDACMSHFVEPLRWMAPIVVGVLDGKLNCPKCETRVGSFNWSGAQCSCGAWVTPAFEIHRKRVDEIIKR